MPSLNLVDEQRQGGDLSGGDLKLTSQIQQPEEMRPPKPEALPTGIKAAPEKPLGILEKPFSEFTTGDKWLWALKSGLMGGNAAIAQKRQVMAARDTQSKEVTDLIIRGLNAVKDIENVDTRVKAGQAIAQRLAKIGGASAAQSFLEVFDEPAVQGVLFSPETIREFGSVHKAMAAREENPKEFRSRAITANIGTIEQELLRLRETDPNIAKMDSNKNGVLTSSEARNWVRKRIQNNDTNLTFEHMDVIQMPEFEPFLADIFEARTTKATGKAQEKDLVRAIDRQGKLVFVTEEELRQDRSLTPEPKKPLVQFGSEKKEEALFESLVKRRDDLREQASAAQSTVSLARTMRDTAMQVMTGTGVETVANLKSAGATIARIAGAENLAKQLEDPNVTNAETLRGLNSRAVSAMIASERSGSTSNAERQKFERAAAGLATTQGGNIALSHIMEAMGTSKVEEAAFFDSVTEQVARGQRLSDVGAQKAWSDYVNDLSYTKGNGANIRFTGSDQNLWRYYLNGRPEKWVFPGGDLTIKQIETIAAAQGLTVRELLSAADKKGTIQGVR